MTPEKTGQEIIPIGEIININGQPFTIVGMFTRYESEQARKERELAKNKPAEQAVAGQIATAGLGPAGRLGFLAQEPHRLHATQHDVGPVPLFDRHRATSRIRA